MFQLHISSCVLSIPTYPDERSIRGTHWWRAPYLGPPLMFFLALSAAVTIYRDIATTVHVKEMLSLYFGLNKHKITDTKDYKEI